MLSSDPWHKCSSGPGDTVVNHTSLMDPSFLGAKMGMKHKEKLRRVISAMKKMTGVGSTCSLILNESAHIPICSECSRRKWIKEWSGKQRRMKCKVKGTRPFIMGLAKSPIGTVATELFNQGRVSYISSLCFQPESSPLLSTIESVLILCLVNNDSQSIMRLSSDSFSF